MLMAAIGDINGNFEGFQAALTAIKELGIHTIAQTGNCAVGGNQGGAVLDLMRQANLLCVQGDKDHRLIRFEKKRQSLRKRMSEIEFDAYAQAFEAISNGNLEFLRTLPRRRRELIDGISILICHGSPSGEKQTLTTETPLMKFQREREIDAADLVICGGPGPAFSRMVETTLFVHPPPVGDERHFALIDTETAPWRIEFRA